MASVIGDLVHEVREGCADPRYARLRTLWTQHNRLQKTEKTPVSIHLHRGYTETWKELIPQEQVVSTDPLERNVELQLRQKLFRYRAIPDDEVLLPTIWLDPVRPAAGESAAARGGAVQGSYLLTWGGRRLWGVDLRLPAPDDATGAYGFVAAIEDEADLAKLRYPHYEVDEPATRALVWRTRELVDDLLPVKLYTDELFPSPAEHLVDFLGHEGFLFAFVDKPALVHRLMNFLTEGYIGYQREREAYGAVDAESSWFFRVHYEELGPDEPYDKLRSSWAYVTAQTTGAISPAMYAEFIHPYNERITGLFGPQRIYYHGCEDLTPKIDIIRNLSGLRRFHVSAWTNLAVAVEKLGNQVVLEAHVAPGKTLMVDSPVEMRQDLRRLVDTTRGVAVDINLADVQTVRHDPSLLTTWAKIAQDVVSGG
ncbi:MAG: uroporphyrinogen decarboxylase family protein [Chloroflexota bacterium]